MEQEFHPAYEEILVKKIFLHKIYFPPIYQQSQRKVTSTEYSN